MTLQFTLLQYLHGSQEGMTQRWLQAFE